MSGPACGKMNKLLNTKHEYVDYREQKMLQFLHNYKDSFENGTW
jgi:hypothetical protein